MHDRPHHTRQFLKKQTFTGPNVLAGFIYDPVYGTYTNTQTHTDFYTCIMLTVFLDYPLVHC